jgi:hypothetical protein
MKKIIIALLTIVLCCSFVFAEDATAEPVLDYTDKVESFAFQPTLSRYNAMGQSGLAVAGRLDNYYTNPAALAEGRFGLSVPSVAFTFYNVQKVVSDSSQRELISLILSGNATEDDSLLLAEKLVKNLGNGYNVLAKFDFSFGVTAGLFGYGTNVQVKFHTLSDGTSNLTNTTIIPEVNVAETVAFGMNIIKTSALKLQVGVSSHFVYKAYLQGQNAKTVSKLLTKEESSDVASLLLWDAPLMAGYAFPFDAGLTLAIADDAVRFSVTANNLNGIYYMKSYSSVGDFVNTLEKKEVIEVPNDHTTRESTEFELTTPWTLNAGFAFAPNVLFNPTLSVDVVDIIGLCEDFGKETFQTSDLLLHLNAGVEVTLAILNLRAGINRGYASVGVGLGVIGVRIDASYGWQEFGAEIGDKPVDSFTIRVNLGYDK